MSFGHHTKGEIQDIHEVRFLKKHAQKYISIQGGWLKLETPKNHQFWW